MKDIVYRFKKFSENLVWRVLCLELVKYWKVKLKIVVLWCNDIEDRYEEDKEVVGRSR